MFISLDGYTLLISWVVHVLYLAFADAMLRPCSMLKMSECGVGETCKGNGTQGVCTCILNYESRNGVCKYIPPDSTTSQPSVPDPDPHTTDGLAGTLWVLIPCTILATLGALVLFLAKRYSITERIYALRIRRYNTVFVSSENVDDDAPIT